ncbi:MAG TPA: adenylate kinase [Pyrinomonadaceae bacterium]|jgi:adenylate kinase|nr:adenylate kinase [Pyrinomonadaceae bacterium]
MPKIIVLMGAPGAGKGTQARLLQERLNLPQISTGDIFRALKDAQTPLAHELREIMTKGQLVPDELTIALVRERTSQADCRSGYILDGFPRTPAQAASLEVLAREQDNVIVPVLIDVPYDLLERRTTGRRSCPVCGEIYNIYFKPPKDDNVCDIHSEAQLTQRADDNAKTVKARVATYEEQTRPLLDYYRKRNLLVTVAGTGDAEDIHNQIADILKN